MSYYSIILHKNHFDFICTSKEEYTVQKYSRYHNVSQNRLTKYMKTWRICCLGWGMHQIYFPDF